MRAEKLLRLLGVLRPRRRGAQAVVKLGAQQPSGRELYSYLVGAYRISLLDVGREVMYVATPNLSQDILRLVEERLDSITALMKKGSDVGDVLTAVLGIPRESVAEALYALRGVVGYGKLQVLLDDPYITDISVVGAGEVWVRHSYLEKFLDVDFIRTNIVFKTVEEVVELQQTIATKCGTYVSTSNPVVEAQLPPRDGGHRAHLVLHTVSTPRRPEIVVRKKLSTPPPLSKLVEEGVLPKAIATLFKVLIHARGSMIVAGPPGSGKTTLLRSVLYSYVPPGWKVAVIEDTGEIDPPPGSSWVRYTTFELGTVRIDLFDLAKAALRSSATKLLVVGETRGSEAQVLAQSLLAGLGGLTTFHAGSVEEVVARLRSHPISLSNSQIGMFNFVAVMGFAEKPRRVLRELAELTYDSSRDEVVVSRVWDRVRDGLGVGFDHVVSRLRRWGELKLRSETPVEAIVDGA